MYTEQFITERSYLKGVSPATVQWYRSSFKAFEGVDTKQAMVERIGESVRLDDVRSSAKADRAAAIAAASWTDM